MKRHVPNLITILRLILTVIFFVILNYDSSDKPTLAEVESSFKLQMWLGFVVFIVATLTDILDGYLARKWKVESAFGRIVDPFVDKILICGAFIFFSSNHFLAAPVKLAFFPKDQYVTGVAPWMVVVLIGREFLITSIRGLAEAQGINFKADWAGKVKMFTQSFAAGAVLVNLATVDRYQWIHVTRDVAILTTVVVTVLSSITYIYRAWQIFSKPPRQAEN